MNDIFEDLGFELTSENGQTTGEQSFNNANDAAVTLIDLKSDLIEAGFEVTSETVQNNNVVCAFSNEDGVPITIIQDTVGLTVTIQSSAE